MNYLNKKNARAHRAGQRPHRDGKWPPGTFLNGLIQAFQDHHHRSRCGKARFVFGWLRHFRFQVVPVLPKRTTDDDATTTTRKKYPASHATARVGPPAQRVGGGHGGAVVLVVGRVAFVSCVAPRGAGTNLNGSRRSGVMVCVSVFVTHQEARGRFLVVP